MLTVLPHDISCAIYLHMFSQKLQESDGWHEALSKETQSKILLAILKMIRNPDMIWGEFLEKVKAVFPSQLYQDFKKEVHNIENADQLISIIKALEQLSLEQHTSSKIASISELNQSKMIKRTSVLGLFLRKVLINLEKLSFTSLQKLYKEFDSYRSTFFSKLPESCENETSQAMDLSCVDENTVSDIVMNFDDTSNSVQTETSMEESSNETNKENISQILPHKSKQKMLLSKHNFLNFIQENVELLENRSFHAVDPHILQQQIDEMKNVYTDVVDVYYLSFLNYLRVSEVNKAKEMLCLYFDYKIFQGHSKSDSGESERHQTMFKRFRYCSLNLGIMHCCHQNYSESIMALEEAVRVSQETNDEVCLKHSLFWLNIVKEETGQLSEANVLQKYNGIIKEIVNEDEQVINKLQDIDCLGILRFSKILAFKGIHDPSHLLATISKVVTSNISVSNDALLTRSSLLDFYGVRLIALFNSQIPLQIIPKLSPRQKSPMLISDEAFVISLCQISMFIGQVHSYEIACNVIEFLLSQVPLYSSYRKVVKLSFSRLEFEKHIKERNVQNALRVAEIVTVWSELEGIFMTAIVDVICMNLSEAAQKISFIKEQLSQLKMSVDPILQAKLMLLSIEIKLSTVEPERCLDDILAVISFTEKLKMCSLLIEAKFCLVRYYELISWYKKGLHMIDHIFIETLANSSTYHQGLIYYFRAKLLHAQHSSPSLNSKQQHAKDPEINSEILRLHNKALEHFRQCHATARMCDVYYEMALVYHGLGKAAKRNAMAKEFRQIHEKIHELNDSCILY